MVGSNIILKCGPNFYRYFQFCNPTYVKVLTITITWSEKTFFTLIN